MINNTIDITTHILYQMIANRTGNNISQYVRTAANEMFHAGSLVISSNESITISYINTCSWLLSYVKDLIDQMRLERRNNFNREYTNKNLTHELAFMIKYDETKYCPHAKEWINMGYELPFKLIQGIMKEKGYMIDVIEGGYREDLYAPWTVIYRLNVCTINQN